MAIISSHILSSVDGSHVGGIPVTLKLVRGGEPLFSVTSDDGGRLSQEVDLTSIPEGSICELVFATDAYWAERSIPSGRIPEIVLRFAILEGKDRYHMPLIIGPYGYSVWNSH